MPLHSLPPLFFACQRHLHRLFICKSRWQMRNQIFTLYNRFRQLLGSYPNLLNGCHPPAKHPATRANVLPLCIFIVALVLA